jgi:RNA polymerase sigma factor (sigma-70 family)
LQACPEKLIRVGDETYTYADWYASFWPRVRRFLSSQGYGRVAEDASQETMLRAWARVDTFVNDGQAFRWCVVVAGRVALDMTKSGRAKHTVLTSPHAMPEHLDPDSCPSIPIALRDRQAQLRAAINELSETDRALVLAAELDGVPDAVLAAQYGAKPNAIRQRRFRARQRLRERLGHLAAPAAPALLLCRSAAAVRSALRWRPDPVAITPFTLGIVVTALGLVAGPFNGPVSSRPRDYPAGGMTRAVELALPGAATQRAAARRPAVGTPSAAGPESLASTHTEPVLGRQRKPVASVCVSGACVGNGSGPADVLTLHLPQPVGDPSVREDVVPLCETAPDSAVADCHTEGRPHYRVSPPPTT